MIHRFTRAIGCLIALAGIGVALPGFARSAPGTEPATAPVPSPPPSTAPSSAPGDSAASKTLTVAILDFDASTPASPDLGKEIGELLLAKLSEDGGITIVDRAALTKLLVEHELNLTGLVDQNQAIKIGKLAGAKLLVTGKAFVLDKQIYITAKIISTETSLVDGVVVKGSVDGDMGMLILELSDKLTKHIKEVGPKLMPADDSALDPLPALKARLAGRKLPKIAVKIAENHIAEDHDVGHTAARVDPAAETELKNVLLQCGFTLVDDDESRWGDDGVEIVIGGNAFSEFGARIGTLVSCSARLEITAKDRKSGTIIFADRTTTRSADLAENTAAKTALQHAGRDLGIRLLEQLDKTARN